MKKLMANKFIMCLAVIVFIFAGCSHGRTSEAKHEDELYIRQEAYQDGYDQAIYDIKGELGEWTWCICVEQEDLAKAIVEYSVKYGLSEEDAEDLRDMILSDIDGTSMKEIISDIG